LERKLLNLIHERLQARTIDDIGVYSKNLLTGEVLMDHQSRKEFKAASTIKLAIACEVERQIHQGIIEPDQEIKVDAQKLVGGSGILKLILKDLVPTVRSMVTLMLVVSDNSATNFLIDLVGRSSVNQLMVSEGLSGIRLAGKLMRRGKVRFNSATPRDMSELIERIYKGKIVSKQSSKRILSVLRFQQHSSMIPAGLPGWWVKFANKPGALSDLRADVAVIWGKGFAYTLSVFVTGFKDSFLGESVVRDISRAVYDVVVR
jgi:beta-lactamase class A